MPQVLKDLIALVESAMAEWGDLRLDRLIFSQASTARLVVIGVMGLAAVVLLARAISKGRPGRRRMALPALVTSAAWSRASLTRHGALLVALAGLPFFILALGDPRTSLTRSEATFPGRRISLLIDASSSMLSALPSSRLAKGAPNNAARRKSRDDRHHILINGLMTGQD